MLPKTQSYTRACDYRNFETFITMIYMILHEITTRMSLPCDRFWGLGCPKIYHKAEDTLAQIGSKLSKNDAVPAKRQSNSIPKWN